MAHRQWRDGIVSIQCLGVGAESAKCYLLALMWTLGAALDAAAFCVGCSSHADGFTPPPSSDAAPPPPPALHIHHEAGGRVFITGTPIECTPVGANGLPHPVVDECNVPLSHVQPRYFLQAQVSDPTWSFAGWTVTACGVRAATLADASIELRFFDYAGDGGSCRVDVDAVFEHAIADAGADG
jgi:hypothetical protein